MNTNENSGFLCFAIVAKYFGVLVPPESGEAFRDTEQTEMQLLLLAKKLHMKAKLGKTNQKKLAKVGIPVLARSKTGEYFIVMRKNGEKWLILKPHIRQPMLLDEGELREEWDGTVFLMRSRKQHNDAMQTEMGFRWFIPTILKFKKELVQVLLAVFTIQILGIVTPVMTQVVVDKVLAHNAMSTLYTISVGIFIVYVYELLLSLAKNYLFVHTTNRVDVLLNYNLFRHLFALPMKYFETRRAGETVARVRELDHIRSFLTGTPLSAVIDMIFVVVYIVILFLYDVPLTLLVIASVPFFAILSLIITPIFKKRLDEKFVAGAQTQSFLVESLNGMQTIKSFSLENSFEEKWGELQADYVKAGYRTAMVSSISSIVATFIQRIFDLLLLFFGAKAVLAGDFTVGQLAAFRMLAGRVSGPVLRLVQLWQEYQQAAMSVKRIGDIFNSPVEPASRTSLQTIPKLQGGITFEKVGFRYRMDGQEIIRGMSFRIQPSTVVGIVGRSGSGKSTISKLIQRLYLPQSGKISIDGMDLSLLNPHILRKQIGVVLQENFMFSGTVAENISIHYKGASTEDIIRAAKIAGAHEFILELQEGYDTVIGEKGIALSGGQKQRIAIARAILHNPPILIFDEATSALDYESESIIQNNLREICRGRTVIIIAHRLSTLQSADKIMVVDKGEVVEYDTPERLLQRRGLYYYLYQQQKKGEIEQR